MRRSIALVALLTACSSSSSSGTTAAASDAGASEAGATTGAPSLATCTTSIADDAPAFFKTYFRCVTITTTADAITIATDGLPPHATYYYGTGNAGYAPFDTSRGADYRPNPNVLRKTTFKMTIPKSPTARGVIVTQALVDGTVGTTPQEYGMGPAGIALDSVLLFNPLAAPGDDIEKEKFTFDDYDAHPAPDGAYHYHTTSKGPLEVTGGLEVYGMMCDGTLVLGCTELDGTTADTASLDAQGGHVADVKDAAGTVHFAQRYHTHVCATGRRFTPEIQYYATCTH